jgi:Predicted transcriptional regulator
MNTTSLPPLAERLKTAMAARNLSGTQLSKLVGVTSGTPISQVAIQKITSGKTLHSKRLPDIAKTLGVTVEWLAYGEDSSRNPDSGTTLVDVGETTTQSSNTDMEERKLRKGFIPVVGTAQLGDDGFFDADGYPVGHGAGYLQIHSDDPDAYGLRVKGDSMSPRIKHGEYVVIEPNQPLVDYEEVLVMTIDGRKMIKVFSGKKDGFYRLESINEDHGPIHIAVDAVEAIHYVAGILKGSRYFEP